MNGLVVLTLLLWTFLCAGCSQSTGGSAQTSAQPSDQSGPVMPTRAQPNLRTMKLWLGAEEVEAELALSPQEQTTGMMFRTNMDENAGMLFPLPQTQRAGFWMTNCPLPLSAAYIDPQGIIQEIHDFEANNPRPVYAASDNIRFVLESPRGWYGRHHIAVGTLVRTERGSLMQTFFRGR